MNVTLICMSRTGHRAVALWMTRKFGHTIRMIESRTFSDSLRATKSATAPPVLLLRDYPNWLASMITYVDKPSLESLNHYTDHWITHAEAADTITTIRFNEWVKGGHGDGIVVSHGERPTGFNGGSVLTRYKEIEGHPLYEKMMRRDDALALSESVFGELCEVAASVA